MRCFDYTKPDDHPATCDKSGITPAILEYNNCTAKPQGCMGISVTGGYVYRGSALPELRGWYVYGDYCTGRIWAATFNGSSWTSIGS